jgi:multiple sugar transport system permease protein
MATTVQFIVCAVSIETLLGLLLALVVARELRFAGLIRVTLILPMTIAPVVVGVIWRLLYASGIGVVDPLFEALGFNAPERARPGVQRFPGSVIVDVWEWTPLMFLIILAGLHSCRRIRSRRRASMAPARSRSSFIIRRRCCPVLW